MTDRAALLQQFVVGQGWGDATIQPLAGDASFRRYVRLLRPAETAVVMDAPPPKENVRPFLHVARTLTGFGYSAPRVMGADEEQGFVLLEDLGDESYNRRIAAGADEAELYGAAVDLLADLAQRPAPPSLPDFDDARILREAELLLDWTWPALARQAVPAGMRDEFQALWRGALPVMRRSSPVLVHFDYHVDNLIWLSSRQGLARVGLLDFQDAVLGPAALDLVSLLEDARRDVPLDLAESMIRRYLAATGVDAAGFRASFAAVGAQRNTRILGVFGRLWLRDGKPGYLKWLPRVWILVERDLAHPDLADLRRWFDEHIPADWRRVAPAPESFALPVAAAPR